MKTECFKLFDYVFLNVKDLSLSIELHFSIDDERFYIRCVNLSTDATFKFINTIRDLFNDETNVLYGPSKYIDDGVYVTLYPTRLAITKQFEAGKNGYQYNFDAGHTRTKDDLKNFNLKINKAIDMYINNLKEIKTIQSKKL